MAFILVFIEGHEKVEQQKIGPWICCRDISKAVFITLHAFPELRTNFPQVSAPGKSAVLLTDLFLMLWTLGMQ